MVVYSEEEDHNCYEGSQDGENMIEQDSNKVPVFSKPQESEETVDIPLSPSIVTQEVEFKPKSLFNSNARKRSRYGNDSNNDLNENESIVSISNSYCQFPEDNESVTYKD